MKKENKKGNLYLIPSLLFPDTLAALPPYILTVIQSTFHFFVENERSARRFFKTLDKTISIDDRKFSLTNTHNPADTALLKKWLQEGYDVGVVSEAGYPCIADPGNILVKTAHEINAKVIPLSGPNAMLMALSASGFSGQQFRFAGYLPLAADKRAKALRALEKKVKQTGETQLFMETPYRNRKLLDEIIRYCHPDSLLCIAADLTAPSEMIDTRKIQDWQKDVPELHKRPAVFLFGA